MKGVLKQIVFCCGVLSCLVLSLPAETNQPLLLVDVDGFNDSEIYPVGNLQPVTDGAATWQPASPTPALITNLSDGGLHGKVLRRVQTGVDNIDYLKFPPVAEGVVEIEFDVRVSSSSARTLDVSLNSASGSTQGPFLMWGTNALNYYDRTAWVPQTSLDTDWHHIKMICYVSGPRANTFDLEVDHAPLSQGLLWRTAEPQTVGTLRLGAIRGTAGQYGEVDNLVLTAMVPYTPPETLVLTNPAGGAQTFAFSFQTKTNREYLVESVGSLAAMSWPPLAIVAGDGLEARFTNQPATNPAQFYRVKQLPPPGYADGYRGIWFTLGQFSEYGDKYSGGLGTYTANHIPIAIYAPAVNKTFFVYGGTIQDRRHLLIMASCFDHATGQVPRPTVVLDKQGVDDPHDNGALAMDDQGYLWVFVSGRANSRPGWKFRSQAPYSVAEFEFIRHDTMTYPQPRHIPGFGFFNLFTKYTNGRELYWETSTNGVNWSAHQKLAGIGGHYQVSNVRPDGLVATFFNRHPGGNVDKRTDLYYVQTTNFGVTWTTASGVPVTVPLTTTNHPARVFDYSSQGKLMYTCDLNFDTNGRPVLLYIVSNNYQPGPAGDPREWTIARWNGSQWITSVVCTSDHNYDMGSLYIQPGRWVVIGPTQNGPQVWQTGGEMALWTSLDQGQTWTMTKQITTNSIYNHTYARRPLHATDPFFVFWADGDPTQVTPSRLYFSNSDGTRVWQLPYDMSTPLAVPQEVSF